MAELSGIRAIYIVKKRATTIVLARFIAITRRIMLFTYSSQRLVDLTPPFQT